MTSSEFRERIVELGAPEVSIFGTNNKKIRLSSSNIICMSLTRDSDGAFATIKALFHPRFFFMYKQAVILLLMLFTASVMPRYLPVICKPSKMLRSGRKW